jgi:hypothetical protein
MLSALNACLVIVGTLISCFLRFAQNWCTLSVGSITKSRQTWYMTQKDIKISVSTQQHDILYTDCRDMLIIYICIMLLQLLYRWGQHQSWKLWISVTCTISYSVLLHRIKSLSGILDKKGIIAWLETNLGVRPFGVSPTCHYFSN